MKAPVLEPTFEHPVRHLQLVETGKHEPHGESKSLPRDPMFVVIVFALIVALVAGGLAYSWQHAQVLDARASLTRATVALNAERNATLGMLSDLRALNGHLAVETQRATQAQNRAAVMQWRMHRKQARLGQAIAAQQAANAHMTVLTGPALANGTYTGTLRTVAGTHQPPYMVTDVSGMNGWRMVEFAPGATVRLTGQLGPVKVTVPQFSRMFAASGPGVNNLAAQKYQFEMHGGQATSIKEVSAP